ncbi:uncharacterized protein [Amphiura filiformis]|uniref:uncharacterized protein n=1 Tax=Amphiura filiformis TaxID=82378 RepID=UPI003B216DA4
MSVKRNIDCTFDGIDHHGSRGTLKKMKSISDDIGPLLDKFHVQQSIEEVDNEENGASTPDATDGTGIPEIAAGQNHVDDWLGELTEVDGFSNDSLFGHLASSTSKQLTNFFKKVNQAAHHGHSTRTDGTKQLQLAPPGNNVYVPHPTLGVSLMLPMGMHIQPINDQFISGISGHKVVRVEKGKLAEQVELRENDVLIAIGETCIRNHSLEDVLRLFGTLDDTFRMTVLREDEKGNTKFLSVTITVSMRITDGNVVSITIIDIYSTPYYYTQTVDKLQISQKTSDEKVRQFLKIDEDGRVTMAPKYVPDQCLFTMNLYHAGKDGLRACTLCNIRNSQALDADDRDQNKIILSKADDLRPEHDTVDSDNRFFYDLTTGVTHEHAFESIEKKDYYLTFEDGTLNLTHQDVKEASKLPSACRFTMCGEKCNVINGEHFEENPKQA